ncbi:DUF4238 domain-containing protein [Psychrobacter sp. B38]|uniref:DUF4238 domain-containing protein n=1 Tax=Psychrobacter sp. B38 TaxID=3143538 RepID=UPI00320FD2EE
MTVTRNNHYVPQWYQKGFTSDRDNELCNLSQKKITLPNGKIKKLDSKKWYTPAQCFYQKDLYSTFLGSEISDEIEQRLFGDIDGAGALAVKAYLTDDQSEWHNNFQSLFFYLDAQKLRTPKGLDWIKSHYPDLSQNQLMIEMQSIRRLHCILWTEGVRELVSAEESDIKFIISDHPVTIYNYACPPNSEQCKYPNDPDISLKGTQTIFPLDKNRCLILTNQEYVQNPDTINPLEQRTNPTKIRNSLVSTIDFINHRKLSSDEVLQINHIIKERSKASVAAGSTDWLHPEKGVGTSWANLRYVLLPPRKEFTTEILAKFNDGSVYYQDAFGCTKSRNTLLEKNIDEGKLRQNDECGCGSGKKYKKCCRDIPKNQRITWKVRSIRERNIALCNEIRRVLGFDSGKTWEDVRHGLTDNQISEIYKFYAFLWPTTTEIYSMLPRPDGKFRALYTGQIDIRKINVYALKVASHFDEFLIQHPFIHPNNVKPSFSPIENPSSYRYQALKEIYLMMTLEPYINSGLINLIPAPNSLDRYLFSEILDMVELRGKESVSEEEKKQFIRLGREDRLNLAFSLLDKERKLLLIDEFSDCTEKEIEEIDKALAEKAKYDPLVPLKDFMTNSTTQNIPFVLVPNYEMSMFIAQVTGSVIVTDSESRWMEFQLAQHRGNGIVHYPWKPIHDSINKIPLDSQVAETFVKPSHSNYVKFRSDLKAINALVASNNQKVETISKWKAEALNCEGNIIREVVDKANIKILAPEGGFYDTNVQRLLLKSNCQHYLDKVDSVYYVTS